MDRATKLFLLLTCPLLACGDDTTTPGDGSTGGEDSTTTNVTVTVNPTTVTVTDTDTDPTADTTDSSDSGVDSTGTTDGTTSSGSSDGGMSSSSSDGGMGSSSSDGSSSDGGTTSGTSTTSGTTSGSSTGGPACGDGVIDVGEDCDDTELGGADCAGLGFAGGVLGCNPDCTYDTSGCTTCGNGAVDMGEDCDGMDLGGSTCADVGMGFTAGTLACDGTCGFDTAGCTSTPWPVAGEVVVTEIMQNPAILPDSDGEYFELYNPTMGDLQLANCFVEGSTDAGFPVAIDELVMGPLSYRTFAITSAGGPGFVPDYQWPIGDFSLNNSSDTVRLVCNGVVVDEVDYDNGATFPDPSGASMNLDPVSYDAIANDLGANWCESTNSFNGDFGTPGADNTACVAPPMYTIDFCRLQFPDLIDEVEGTNVDVFGRVFIAGLTDLSGVNDPAPEVIGYVGWGPDGTDPAVDPGWTWFAGTPNAGYGPASPGYEANNDEYQALLTVPSPPGSYDFAFAFSGDGGATLTYCDGQPAGSSDGYQPANAGQMTSQPGMVPTNLYFSEYAEGSSSNKAFEIYNAAAADADLTSCEVNFYFNGGAAPSNTINLAGTLVAGDVLVVCDDSIDPLVFDPMLCDVLDNGSFYNGNDALELVCSGTVLDVIGQIGTDPGSEWVGGGVGTQNETIRRDCAVTTGDSNGADAFDPSLEWATFPQDDFSDFGQYICP